MRVFLIFIGILAFVYILYAGYFYHIQRWIIFPRHLLPPQQGTIADHPGWQQQWFELPDAQVETWFLPADRTRYPAGAPLFILTHGNGEYIDLWPQRVTQLERQGYAVLLVEYPGYGRSTGEPSEETISTSLTLAYDWAVAQPGVDQERVVLFGFSVGGGAISTLAAQRPSSALILMSTFTSIRDMASAFYLPSFLTRDPFDTLSIVRKYANPIFLIHGTNDATIPHTNSITLNAAAANSKLLLLPCGHADCVDDWDEFWLMVEDFLNERRPVEHK